MHRARPGLTAPPDAPDNAAVAFPALRRPLRAGVALAALVLAAQAHPQTPVHHGVLGVRPAAGRIDRTTGESSLDVRRWRFTPAPDSDGLDPAHEAVLVAIGDADRFVVPAGALRASRNGRVFTYRRATTRGVRRLRLVRVGR